MGRSGYEDSGFDSQEDQWSYIRYRGALKSAIRGKKGQTFLKELAEELDAMSVKELVANELEDGENFCALGVLGNKRGLVMRDIDPDDIEFCAELFNMNEKLYREIVYINDECCWHENKKNERWKKVRKWVDENINKN